MASGSGWSPVPVAVSAALGVAVVGVAAPLAGLPWWAPASAATILAALAGLAGGVAVAMGRIGPWRNAHTITAVLVAGALASWLAAGAGLAAWATVLLVVAVGLAILSYAVPPAAAVEAADELVRDRRPTAVRSWEASLRRVYGKDLVVEAVTPWPDGNGEDVVVDLAGVASPSQVAAPAQLDLLVSNRRLDQGCGIEVGDGRHQGEVVLHVQLAATLMRDRAWTSDTSQASILDPIVLADDAKGNEVTVCLRHDCALVGGATGAGKTTVLTTTIMHGQRCPDALQWVMDLNGAGVAVPMIEPWARGECDTPGIDWFADDLKEALAMAVVARAIAKDRKKSPRIRAHMRAANIDIVPVAPDCREVLVYADEIAEMRKGRGPIALLSSLVDESVRSIVEIGRAAAVRVFQSALRGTSDVTDRASKVQMGIRIAMKAREYSEYSAFLGGIWPPKTRLTLPGQCWVLRDSDPRPLMARTRFVDPALIAPHVVATSRYRGELDEEGRAVARGLNRLEDFFPPALIDRQLRESLLGQHILAGRVYEGRWERQAAVLAGMRGEEVPDPGVEDRAAAAPIADQHRIPGLDEFRRVAGLVAPTPAAPAAETPASARPVPPAELDVDAAFAELTRAEHFVGRTGTPRVDPSAGRDREPVERPAAGGETTRDRILAILTQEAAGLTGAELDARLLALGRPVSRQARDQACKGLLGAGKVVRMDGAEGIVWRVP